MKRLAFLAVVVLGAAAIAVPVTIAVGATSVSVTGPLSSRRRRRVARDPKASRCETLSVARSCAMAE